ncbi:MAG: 2-dehydropantoate 2-reductase [Deltaproteobacteria bacterium SG8_13]|nr:MAG: 2-dehydropantoate 2-reductase [Deltaproteobacteria bacterium SG8_13]
MKIAVFGSGAVGGYFGGRLAQAGKDVTFVARGRHLEAMSTSGLQVQSINGDFTVDPVKATSRPEEIGTVDVVFCCVKSWQVAEASAAIRLLVGPQTVVIPLQNGVEAHTTLSRALGAEHVLPGLCRLISMIEAPGRIRHAGADPYLAFGEPDGRLSRRTKNVERELADAQGVTVEVSEHILADLWKKFMLIAPWSGIGALTRSPIGVCRKLPETRELLLQSIREVYDVARANGVELEETAVDATVDFLDRFPPEGTASMQRDVMDGRPSELHEQCGAVVRLGEKAGVPTPVNRFVYHSLLPLEHKARGEISF